MRVLSLAFFAAMCFGQAVADTVDPRVRSFVRPVRVVLKSDGSYETTVQAPEGVKVIRATSAKGGR